MIFWLASSASCAFAWWHSGFSGWAFAAGMTVGFAFDSWFAHPEINVIIDRRVAQEHDAQ